MLRRILVHLRSTPARLQGQGGNKRGGARKGQGLGKGKGEVVKKREASNTGLVWGKSRTDTRLPGGFSALPGFSALREL